MPSSVSDKQSQPQYNILVGLIKGHRKCDSTKRERGSLSVWRTEGKEGTYLKPGQNLCPEKKLVK